MKRTILIIVIVIAAMVLLLLLNKQAKTAKKELASQASTLVAVQVEAVNDTTYSLGFSSNGTLEPYRELAFVSDVAGRVTTIFADEGTQVRAGSVLLQVDDELLRADYNASEAAWKALKTDVERVSNASEKGGVSLQQRDNLRTQLIAAESRMIASKRRLSDATVKAPISGVINRRYVEVGAYLNPGARLFDILDDSSLKLWVNVTERQVLGLKKGARVRLTCSAFPGELYTGTLSYVGNKGDKAFNYPVEITLAASEKKKLLSGMYVTVHFEDQAPQQGLLIPRNAIVGSVKGASVYVVEQGVAHKTPVVIGAVVGKRVEVLSGLSAGDSLVTTGLINVTEGSRIKTIQR